ncbi:MAG: FHA domain-containing protein [Clostridia bacterium]|nr:FHA domain-containing protein [Clostridia bacterium]
MSANAYEILALAMRYVFAGLMVLIVLRAWRISLVDSRRATKLRRLSPDTGIIGEMLVVNGSERARPGMHYPVTLEGTIGSNRRADIRVRHSTVRGRHAIYQMTDEGLFVRGHANARIRDKFGRGARELMLQDGDILRIGDVALMLVLTDGGSEPEEMNRRVLRRRMRSRNEMPDDEGFDDGIFETFEHFEPEPEADDLFMSNPASAFDRRADEYDEFNDF